MNQHKKKSFSSHSRRGKFSKRPRRGSKPFGRKPKKKKKRITLPPEVQAKVDELMQKNGLTFPFALAVAQKKMTLPQALSEMLRKKKIAEIARKYRLPRPLAGQVAAKRMSPEEAKQIIYFQKVQRMHRAKSCFADSFRTQDPFILHCHGGQVRTGVVITNDPYDIDWRESGQEEIIRFPKLEVKFAYPKPLEGKVSIGKDEEVAAKGMGPIQRIVERYRIKDTKLKDYLLSQKQVRFTTLEGDVLEGKVKWFNIYEIGLEQEEGVVVYLLRHALFAWEEI